MTPEVGRSNRPLRAMQKLYIIIRSDLAAGLQIAQACHALRCFTHAHPKEDRAWFYGPDQTLEPRGPNNIVVLQVPDEKALHDLFCRAVRDPDVAGAPFYEPDLDDSLTAIALGGEGASRYVSSLPLALRELTASAA